MSKAIGRQFGNFLPYELWVGVGVLAYNFSVLCWQLWSSCRVAEYSHGLDWLLGCTTIVFFYGLQFFLPVVLIGVGVAIVNALLSFAHRASVDVLEQHLRLGSGLRTILVRLWLVETGVFLGMLFAFYVNCCTADPMAGGYFH